MALEVGYVGSHSTHLTQATANININALNPALLSQGAALTATVANPFFNNGGAGVIGSATLSQVQLLLPYPTFSTINLQYNDSSHARYDSLVAKVQKRMSMGVTVLSTLTWSRNHDASSGGAGNFLNAGAAGPQNPYDMGSEYSLANVDTPLRWSTGFTFELPFGKNKKFLGTSKALDYAVGGWSVNAVSVYQSGFPMQITQSTNNNSVFGYASQRPNASGTSPVTTGSLESRLEQLHQRGSLHDGGARHVRQHFADARDAGTRAGQLGHLDFQEHLHHGEVQGAVPGRGAECVQHADVRRTQHIVREQFVRTDHVAGELLTHDAVGDAVLLLKRTQFDSKRAAPQGAALFCVRRQAGRSVLQKKTRTRTGLGRVER